jgi:filamentous hemagglutinin family protein
VAVKGSRLIVSLAALAWADAAAAQQAGMIQPGSAPGIINEGAASPAGIQVTAPEPVPTDIRPDRDNALDLGTQVTQSGRNYVIDGGTRAGSNLFHSFSRFDLGQGDFASWVHSAGNPLTISNVISRVTGGGPSRIFGTMDSTALPNANFFFINPAGIVFGDGAQVNVPAGAHFSTASEVRFAQGPAFTVATPNGSTFSVASPAAFGFVGGEASVRVSGATPNFLPGAGALTLSGADVTVEGSTLTVGSLALAGTGGGPATLDLAGTLTSAAPGNVTISGSSITATGEGGITIAGGTVSLADAALSAHSSAGVPSGGIAVRGAQSVSLTTSTLTTTSGAGGSTEQGGEIFLSAPDLLIGDSVIETKAAGSGAAGSLLFQAGRLRIADSNIRSVIEDDATGAAHAIAASEFELLNSAIGAESTSTTGTAGSFDIVADTVRVQDSGIFSYAFNGGRTGDLSLRASRVELGNSLVASQHLGRGGAGSVEIIADSVLMDASRLDSDATEEEDGETGGIRLRANTALLRNGSEISSTTFGSANGGFIDVSVRELELDSSRITANTLAGSSGVGGLVTIASRNLTLRNGSAIQTESAGTGDAGLILISGSNSVTVTGMSEIESDTFGAGDAGLIKIDTSRFELSGNSLINSNSLGSGGAGFIIINARQALIADSGIETSTVEGTGGLIELNIPGTLTMRRASLGATTAWLRQWRPNRCYGRRAAHVRVDHGLQRLRQRRRGRRQPGRDRRPPARSGIRHSERGRAVLDRECRPRPRECRGHSDRYRGQRHLKQQPGKRTGRDHSNPGRSDPRHRRGRNLD